MVEWLYLNPLNENNNNNGDRSDSAHYKLYFWKEADCGAQLHHMALCCQVAFMSRLCYCKWVGSNWLVVFFRKHLGFK